MLRSIIISCMLLASFTLSAQQTKTLEFRSLPYLQNMTTDGVTVISVANKPCYSYIRYGETKQLDKKTFASHHGQVDADMPVQKIRLSGLKPGKKYYYQVVTKEITVYQAYKIRYGDSIVSDVHSFTLPTSHTDKFSFLAFNDVHTQPAYIDTICRQYPDFDFVCYNGDIIDDLEVENDIVKYLCNASSVAFAADKPFVYTRGNHETRGSKSRLLSQYVETPNGEYFYTFTWGNTCFMILDTGEDKPDNHPVYGGLTDYDRYRAQQAEWMKTVFASKEWKRAKHRIVCGHIPASLENDGWYTSKELAVKFVPLLNKAKVDVYLAGHTHVAKLERPDKNHNYALVIGGGPVYENHGSGTTCIKVNVDGVKLNVQLFRKDGTLIDEYSVK